MSYKSDITGDKTPLIKERKDIMKKRFLEILLLGAMGAALLAGCKGGEAIAGAQSAPATVEAGTETLGGGTAAAAEAGSAELTFEDIQDSYVKLVDAYNQVEELYMSDKVAQDDRIEELLRETKGIIEQMGEAKREDFTSQEDYITVHNSMATLINSLIDIVGNMKEVAPASEGNGGNDEAAQSVDGLTLGYAGASEGGEELYLATDKDVHKGILGIAGKDGATFISGDITEEDGALTIVDSEAGKSLTFTLEEDTDKEGKRILILTVPANGAKGALYEAEVSAV
ncbi:MAG: hypothetical protein IJU93_10435, partial [Lachnospiraceae bacterium]|nr:hypothetical protein [Lachnospiraceae bacterium]